MQSSVELASIRLEIISSVTVFPLHNQLVDTTDSKFATLEKTYKGKYKGTKPASLTIDCPSGEVK